MLDTSKFKLPPFKHQVEGVEFLLTRPYAALFDEPGAGKSYQIVNLACLLYEAGEIDTVVVACPAGVKSVWASLHFGEVQKHCYLPATLGTFDGQHQTLHPSFDRLYWVVVSYEFLRDKGHVKKLIAGLHDHRLKVMLVCDESIRLKSWNAQQTSGVLMLRKHCKRAYILNGTPIGNSPLDLYSQMEVLDPKILGAKNFFQFKHRHAQFGGYLNKQIVGYHGLEQLQNQIKPYALRRLKKDCLDLPDKIFTQVEVPLDEKHWATYKQMRDQMIVWLGDENPAIARQAITKIIRLAQITSGFLPDEAEVVHWMGDEKRRWLETWAEDRIAEDPNCAIIVWSRFTDELNANYEHFRKKYQSVRIQGGQSVKVRDHATATFMGDGDGHKQGPVFLFGQPQAGGLGLTLTRSHLVVFMSNDYNYVTRVQAVDRTHRPGQQDHPVYVDVLATGPQGQRAIDHTIFKALGKKDDLAMWTSNAWRTALEDERDSPF